MSQHKNTAPNNDQMSDFLVVLFHIFGYNADLLKGRHFLESRRQILNHGILTLCASTLSTVCVGCAFALSFSQFNVFVAIFLIVWFAFSLTSGVGMMMSVGWRSAAIRAFVLIFIGLAAGQGLTMMAASGETEARARVANSSTNASHYRLATETRAAWNDKIGKTENKLTELRTLATELESLRNAEEGAIHFKSNQFNAKRSTVSGQGDLYTFYNNRYESTLQEIKKLEKTLESQKTESAKELAVVEDQAKRFARAEEPTTISNQAAYYRLADDPDPYVQKATFYTSIGLKLITIIIELLPSLFKMLTPPTAIDKLIRLNDQLAHTVLEDMREVKEKLLDTIMETARDKKVTPVALVDTIEILSEFLPDMTPKPKLDEKEAHIDTETETQSTQAHAA